jgi:hypothetical protein
VTGHGVPSRTVGTVLVALVVVQGALLLWHHQRGGTDPHHVPVGLHGPPVLTQGAADQLAALPGEPIEAIVLRPTTDPQDPVRSGDVVGAISIDLDRPDNVLLVSAVADPDLVPVLDDLADRLSTHMERGVVTREVPPAKNPDVSRGALAAVTGSWVVSGFALAVGWSWWRRFRGLGRPGGGFVLGLAGASLLAGSVTDLVASFQGGSFLTWALLGSATTFTTGIAATALEALLGRIGLALATTLLVFVDGPLFGGRDSRLLPSPWAEMAPWTLHGAAATLTERLTWYDGGDLLAPALVLGGVAVMALAVVLAAGVGDCAHWPWRCRWPCRWSPPPCSPRRARRSCPRHLCPGRRRPSAWRRRRGRTPPRSTSSTSS